MPGLHGALSVASAATASLPTGQRGQANTVWRDAFSRYQARNAGQAPEVGQGNCWRKHARTALTPSPGDEQAPDTISKGERVPGDQVVTVENAARAAPLHPGRRNACFLPIHRSPGGSAGGRQMG